MNFIKLRRSVVLICICIFLPAIQNSIFSQNKVKPTRQSSMEAFSNGKYEQAYNEFRELLLTYSKDPLYKYYSAVCLIRLNRDPSEAVKLLQEALQGSAAVKTLPSDGLFYLGRAQQQAGQFTEAVASYNAYTDQVGKKASRDMGVPELLQQCNEKKGQVSETTATRSDVITTNKPDTSLIKRQQTALNETKPVTSQKLSSGKDKILSEALEFQFKADSLNALITRQRADLDKVTGSQKTVLINSIASNTRLAASFQSSADQKYKEANPSVRDTARKELNPASLPVNVKKDTAIVINNRTVNKNQQQIINQAAPSQNLKTPKEVFSYFEIVAVTDPKAKIVIDPEIPAGLVYRIQMGVFRNPLLPAYFKGITPVNGFKVAGTDKIIYYAGMFRRSADAGKALTEVKGKGFRDAFVVALSANKTISMDRANVLEKEWGKRPFVIINPESDTITPTLAYRVEVTRSLTPLKEDVMEPMRKIAGTRGLDTEILEDGYTTYLIGKFITFETAAEYADLLKRNGYREAQVVARLGKKVITLETAKQLFENLK